MAKPKKEKGYGRMVSLEGELRRIRRGTKSRLDRSYLTWAIDYIEAESEPQHPAVAELEKLYRLDDPRG